MKKRIPYGVANYKQLVLEYGYYVDKTEYIRMLEDFHSPVFLRPRRFGKSLWCTTLEYYYDQQHASEFESLFGNTAIGKDPTPNRNQYVVWSLDFSEVPLCEDLHQLRADFDTILNASLLTCVHRYEAMIDSPIAFDETKSVSVNLSTLSQRIREYDLAPLYVIIDEYDNFTNQLITAQNQQLYDDLNRENGFFKGFFKTLKRAVKSQAVAQCFITGVLPIAIDELASGYNIAQFLTLDASFEAMMGFTQQEVDDLLEAIYLDHSLDAETRPQIEELLRNHYNGYQFTSPQGSRLYNSTILFYFLDHLCRHYEIPKFLTDRNLKTDLKWIKRLTGSNPQITERFVDQVLWQDGVPFDETQLLEKFDTHRFFDPEFFPMSFFYLGMLTRADEFSMRLPNLNMRTIFTEYFNELHEVQVLPDYAETMRGFLDSYDFPQLFADYWRLYIGQLPEAVFQNLNENFYRTTFYDLCRRYLSSYFLWHLERSYPGGRSDWEMVGKPGTRFAGKRILAEFKYWSNHRLSKAGLSVDTFKALPEDRKQLQKYTTALQQETPEAEIESYLIYCLGNQGFQVSRLFNGKTNG